MDRAGVPVMPGSQNNLESSAEALKTAENIGFPVLVKATPAAAVRNAPR
jgi:biotin carboxylase